MYGAGWKGLIDKKYIKGEHIPNNELRKAYSSCKILLCDHWDDMRDKGFLSNRLFDASACGAFIISDKVKGVEDVFRDILLTYNDQDELKILLNNYLNSKTKREERSEASKEITIYHFTYRKRAEKILKII